MAEVQAAYPAGTAACSNTGIGDRMKLSFPLAVVLALLANLVPTFNRPDANSQAASNAPQPPQTNS